MLSLWVAGAALALLACAQPQPAAPAPAGGEADAPKFGGVLNLVGDDLTGWDMGYTGQSSINIKVHGFVYDGLLRFKKGPGLEFVSQILQPELAERWEVSPDARVYTFYLQKGVKFTDTPPVNGRELTAADVKWSLEYYSRTGEFKDKGLPPSQSRGLYEGLDSVEAPDRYTVRIRFKEPFVPFLNYTASQWMPIAAKEIYEADGNLTSRLVGTGPYFLDLQNSQKGTRWVLTKNPSYWDAPKPYLEAVRRLIIPDEGARQAAFQVKQLDILEALTDYNAAQAIKKANPQATVSEVLNPELHLMFISQRPGRAAGLTDIRVRRAISLAMDRDEFNKVFSGGKGGWRVAGAWPGLFTESEAREMYPTDLAKAKGLLAEAGYPNGMTLELLTLTTAASVQHQLIQAQLKRAGIELTFILVPREQARQRLYSGDYDLFHGGGGAIGDADFDAWQFAFHSTSLQNWAQIRDRELDKLILAQRQAPDPQKRREAQRAVVRHIHEMAWNPGYIYGAVTEFWHPYVKNYSPHWTTGEDYAFVWLDK